MFQKFRRIYRTGRQQHFATCQNLIAAVAAGVFDPCCAPALEDHALRQGVGDNPQIRAVHRRTQEGLCRIPAPSAVLVDLEKTGTLVAAGIEINCRHIAEFLRALLKSLEDVPGQSLFRDFPFSAGPVQVRSAGMMILGFQEMGQHVVPAPTGVAHLAPVVVIRGLAPHVDHSVDRTAAAQNLAARIDKTAPVQARFARGFHHPVDTGIADAIEVSDRYMDPVVIVISARLQQQNPRFRILGQAVRQNTTRGSTADDHIVIGTVEFCCGHLLRFLHCDEGQGLAGTCGLTRLFRKFDDPIQGRVRKII